MEKQLTQEETVTKVLLALESIRPFLNKDGGDIELIDIIENRVVIAFRGMCAGCHSATFTRQDFIEAKLREFVTPEICVEEEEK